MHDLHHRISSVVCEKSASTSRNARVLMVAEREGKHVDTHHLLQTPHATVHSSVVADCWLAWHSMPGAKGRGHAEITEYPKIQNKKKKIRKHRERT